MIYICKGCTGICTGCGKCASASCQACGNGCSGICKCFDETCAGLTSIFGGCCAAIGAFFGGICTPICQVLDRPLGGYVLLTALITLPASACGAAGLSKKSVWACNVAPLVALCAIDLVLGLVHTGMALYLQHRLVHGLAESGILAAPGAPQQAAVPQQNLTGKELMKRAGNIVLYDVGFCIYIFVFFFSFIFNCVGFGWVAECSPNTSLPLAAAILLVIFFVVAINFGCLWICVMCCDTCCSGLFGSGSGHQGGAQQGGLTRFIIGKPAHPQPGGPVQGVPIAAAAYNQPHHQPGVQQTPVQVIQQQPPVAQAMPAPSAPPMPVAQAQPAQAQPQQQPHPQPQLAAVAAGGLQMAGRGLQTAGRWLAGDKRT